MLFQLVGFFGAREGQRLFDEGLAALPFGGEGEVFEFEQCEVVGGGKEAQAREMIEPEDLRRIGAETVFEFGEDGVDFFEGDRFAEAVVDLHAQGGFVDVVFGKAGIEGEFHLGLGEGGRAFFLRASIALLSSLQ